MACALATATRKTDRPPTVHVGLRPYKHLNTGVDPAHPAATTHVTGQPLRLAEASRDTRCPVCAPSRWHLPRANAGRSAGKPPTYGWLILILPRAKP